MKKFSGNLVETRICRTPETETIMLRGRIKFNEVSIRMNMSVFGFAAVTKILLTFFSFCFFYVFLGEGRGRVAYFRLFIYLSIYLLNEGSIYFCQLQLH